MTALNRHELSDVAGLSFSEFENTDLEAVGAYTPTAVRLRTPTTANPAAGLDSPALPSVRGSKSGTASKGQSNSGAGADAVLPFVPENDVPPLPLISVKGDEDLLFLPPMHAQRHQQQNELGVPDSAALSDVTSPPSGSGRPFTTPAKARAPPAVPSLSLTALFGARPGSTAARIYPEQVPLQLPQQQETSFARATAPPAASAADEGIIITSRMLDLEVGPSGQRTMSKTGSSTARSSRGVPAVVAVAATAGGSSSGSRGITTSAGVVPDGAVAAAGGLPQSLRSKIVRSSPDSMAHHSAHADALAAASGSGSGPGSGSGSGSRLGSSIAVSGAASRQGSMQGSRIHGAHQGAQLEVCVDNQDGPPQAAAHPEFSLRSAVLPSSPTQWLQDATIAVGTQRKGVNFQLAAVADTESPLLQPGSHELQPVVNFGALNAGGGARGIGRGVLAEGADPFSATVNGAAAVATGRPSSLAVASGGTLQQALKQAATSRGLIVEGLEALSRGPPDSALVLSSGQMSHEPMSQQGLSQQPSKDGLALVDEALHEMLSPSSSKRQEQGQEQGAKGKKAVVTVGDCGEEEGRWTSGVGFDPQRGSANNMLLMQAKEPMVVEDASPQCWRELALGHQHEGEVAREEAKRRAHQEFTYKAPLIPTIDPAKSRWLRHWDVFMLILVFYVAFLVPLQVVFFESIEGGWYAMNWITNIILIVDSFVQCNIIYYDPLLNKYVTERKLIFKAFAKRWLIIDLIGNIPWDELTNAIANAMHASEHTRAILKIIKLLRIFQVFRVTRISPRASAAFALDYGLLALGGLLVETMVLTSWIACFWGLLPELENSEFNWMTKFYDSLENVRQDEDWGAVMQRYALSVYFAFSTISGVYGDATPLTLTERFCSIVTMIVGAFYFGYVVGCITSIISMRSAAKQAFHQTMDELTAFMEENHLPSDLRYKLRQYFQYKSQKANPNWQVLLNSMSPALKKEVAVQTSIRWVRCVEQFGGVSEDCLHALSSHLHIMTFTPREAILKEREPCEELCVVRRGVCACQGNVYPRGGVFGTDMLQAMCIASGPNMRRHYTALALTFADVLTLSMDDLAGVLEKHPADAKVVRAAVLRELWREEVRGYHRAMMHLLTGERTKTACRRGDPSGRERHYYSRLSDLLPAGDADFYHEDREGGQLALVNDLAANFYHARKRCGGKRRQSFLASNGSINNLARLASENMAAEESSSSSEEDEGVDVSKMMPYSMTARGSQRGSFQSGFFDRPSQPHSGAPSHAVSRINSTTHLDAGGLVATSSTHRYTGASGSGLVPALRRSSQSNVPTSGIVAAAAAAVKEAAATAASKESTPPMTELQIQELRRESFYSNRPGAHPGAGGSIPAAAAAIPLDSEPPSQAGFLQIPQIQQLQQLEIVSGSGSGVEPLLGSQGGPPAHKESDTSLASGLAGPGSNNGGAPGSGGGQGPGPAAFGGARRRSVEFARGSMELSTQDLQNFLGGGPHPSSTASVSQLGHMSTTGLGHMPSGFADIDPADTNALLRLLLHQVSMLHHSQHKNRHDLWTVAQALSQQIKKTVAKSNKDHMADAL